MTEDDIIIHPRKTSRDVTLPSHGILFVNPAEAKAALAALLEQGGQQAFLHNSRLAISARNDFFMAGPAIGAPVATLAMEKLIALGATNIILMGWCGAVDKDYSIGDIIVPSGGVCGEGTSQYYGGDTVAKPSSSATVSLKKQLAKNSLPVRDGIIWSTDAPYRESRSFLKELNIRKKVVGVDMEFSALCNVAKFREIDFAAVLVVSDELWGSAWNPGFSKNIFQQRCQQVMQILLRMV